MLIEETNKRLGNPDFKFMCLSRPRRFGKSIAEDMLAAYYSKGADSRNLFAPYRISKAEDFEKHLNNFNVTKIDLNAMYGTWIGMTAEERSGHSFVIFFAGSLQRIQKRLQRHIIRKSNKLSVSLDSVKFLRISSNSFHNFCA